MDTPHLVLATRNFPKDLIATVYNLAGIFGGYDWRMHELKGVLAGTFRNKLDWPMSRELSIRVDASREAYFLGRSLRSATPNDILDPP